MSGKILRIHPEDNVLVALAALKAVEEIVLDSKAIKIQSDIPAKHKVVIDTMNPNDEIKMYGITVGKALSPIPSGAAISTQNVKHQAASFSGKTKTFQWNAPDVSK